MAQARIRLLSTDDGWSALYADGKLVYQDHSGNMTIANFIKTLKAAGVATCFDFQEVPLAEIDEDEVMSWGEFPEDATDFKETKL